MAKANPDFISEKTAKKHVYDEKTFNNIFNAYVKARIAAITTGGSIYDVFKKIENNEQQLDAYLEAQQAFQAEARRFKYAKRALISSMF